MSLHGIGINRYYGYHELEYDPFVELVANFNLMSSV